MHRYTVENQPDRWCLDDLSKEGCMRSAVGLDLLLLGIGIVLRLPVHSHAVGEEIGHDLFSETCND